MFAAGIRALPYAARAGRAVYNVGRGVLGYGRQGYRAAMMGAGRAGGRIGVRGRGGRFLENQAATYYRGQARVGTASGLASGVETGRRFLTEGGDSSSHGVTSLPITPQHVQDAVATAQAAADAANASIDLANAAIGRLKRGREDDGGGARKRLKYDGNVAGGSGGRAESFYIHALQNKFSKKTKKNAAKKNKGKKKKNVKKKNKNVTFA